MGDSEVRPEPMSDVSGDRERDVGVIRNRQPVDVLEGSQRNEQTDDEINDGDSDCEEPAAAG